MYLLPFLWATIANLKKAWLCLSEKAKHFYKQKIIPRCEEVNLIKKIISNEKIVIIVESLYLRDKLYSNAKYNEKRLGLMIRRDKLSEEENKILSEIFSKCSKQIKNCYHVNDNLLSLLPAIKKKKKYKKIIRNSKFDEYFYCEWLKTEDRLALYYYKLFKDNPNQLSFLEKEKIIIPKNPDAGDYIESEIVENSLDDFDKNRKFFAIFMFIDDF